MPLYDYRCDKGHQTEVLARADEPAPAACETCGGPLERQLHAPAIRYRGPGFYSTDYGRPAGAR